MTPATFSFRKAGQKEVALCYDSTNMLMLCPICAGEFETDSRVCPDCQFELVPSSLNRGAAVVEEAQSGEVELVELCRPTTYPIAMLIKQMLEQNGVVVVMQGAHSLSVQPNLMFGGQLRVMVPVTQLEFARELYKAYFEADEDTDYIEER
jgi:hypothetical protein